MRKNWFRNKNETKKKKTHLAAYSSAGIVALFALAAYLALSGGTAITTGFFPKSTSFGGKELPIYCVDTTEKKVALSFDAAWGADDFDRIMETLEKHKVHVTFFMTGGWVESYPDCVKKLVEKGHDLGNHSEHHYDMTTISKEEMKSELMTVHNKVKELTGYEMFLFRPPYGAYDNNVIKLAYDCNYYPIQWSVDAGVTTEKPVKSSGCGHFARNRFFLFSHICFCPFTQKSYCIFPADTLIIEEKVTVEISHTEKALQYLQLVSRTSYGRNDL